MDESGDKGYPRKPGTAKHFVLGGLAIHEGQWYTLSKAMDEVQEQYLPGSREVRGRVEFHGEPIRHGKNEFRELCTHTRERMLLDLWGLPARLGMRCDPDPHTLAQELMFFAIAVDRSCYQPTSGRFEDLYEWAVEELCQRVNVHLSSMHKAGNPQKAVFVFDARNQGENEAEEDPADGPIPPVL